MFYCVLVIHALWRDCSELWAWRNVITSFLTGVPWSIPAGMVAASFLWYSALCHFNLCKCAIEWQQPCTCLNSATFRAVFDDDYPLSTWLELAITTHRDTLTGVSMKYFQAEFIEEGNISWRTSIVPVACLHCCLIAAWEHNVTSLLTLLPPPFQAVKDCIPQNWEPK